MTAVGRGSGQRAAAHASRRRWACRLRRGGASPACPGPAPPQRARCGRAPGSALPARIVRASRTRERARSSRPFAAVTAASRRSTSARGRLPLRGTPVGQGSIEPRLGLLDSTLASHRESAREGECATSGVLSSPQPSALSSASEATRSPPGASPASVDGQRPRGPPVQVDEGVARIVADGLEDPDRGVWVTREHEAHRQAGAPDPRPRRAAPAVGRRGSAQHPCCRERSVPMNGARAIAIATPMSSRPSGVGPSQGARSATARAVRRPSRSRPRMPALIASTHASGAVNAPRSGPTASSSAWSVSKRPTARELAPAAGDLEASTTGGLRPGARGAPSAPGRPGPRTSPRHAGGARGPVPATRWSGSIAGRRRRAGGSGTRCRRRRARSGTGCRDGAPAAGPSSRSSP